MNDGILKKALSFLDRRQAAIIFLAAFAYLLYCAVPTLYWGDSAEMVSVGCSLGVAHSPGYPLYTQLAGLFSVLPLEPFPFRANVLSALLGAASLLLAYLSVRELTGSKFGGIVAVAGLIGCKAFVFYSLMAEVYAFHLALFLGALYLIALHARDKSVVKLLAALLLIFLGAGHHLLMVFVFFAVVIYLAVLPGHGWRVAAGPLFFMLGYAMVNLFRSFDALPLVTTIAQWSLVGLAGAYVGYVVFLAVKRKGVPRMLATALVAVFAFAAAAAVFWYLPLSSSRGPVADWWSPKDITNFLNLLLLKGYKSTMPVDKLEWIRRIDTVNFISQTPIPVLVLAIPGAIFMFRKNWRVALFLVLIGLATFAGTLFIQHGKPEALRLPVYTIIFLLAGAGATAVATWRHFKGAVWRRSLAWTATAAAIVAVILNLNDADWRFMNRSGAAYALGKSIIDDTRSRSLLFLGLQTPSIMGYFRACEPDELESKEIAVIPVSFLPFKWELEQLHRAYRDVTFPPTPEDFDEQQQIFRVDDTARVSYAMSLAAANPDMAVFTDFQFVPDNMEKITIPHGAVYQVVDGDTLTTIVKELIAADKEPDWRGLPAKDGTSSENIASIYNERGKIYLQYGMNYGEEKYTRKAMKEFNKALKIAPEYAPALANKGQALIFFRQEKRGLDMMKKALALAPTDPSLYEALATVKFRQQTQQGVQESIALWQMAAVLDPHNARALNNIGSALVAIQQKEAAVEQYKRAIDIDPNYISAYINLSRVYNQMHACAGAVDALERAKDRRSDMLAIRTELAEQYYDCRMQHLYAQVMDDILADFPHDRKLYYALAIIFRNVGQYDNLVASIGELRKFDPKFPIQSLFVTLEPCERAIKVLSEVQRRMPNDQQLYLTLGARYYNCGKPQKAIETFSAGMKLPGGGAFKVLIDQIKSGKDLSEMINPYNTKSPLLGGGK